VRNGLDIFGLLILGRAFCRAFTAVRQTRKTYENKVNGARLPEFSAEMIALYHREKEQSSKQTGNSMLVSP
jgi:hypothetical protein